MRSNIFLITICLVVLFAPLASTQEEGGTVNTPSLDEQLEAILETFDKTMTEEPSHRHHIRAEILFRLGRFEEAVQDYDKAVTVGRPHNEDSCWERGLAQYYAGDYEAGRDQFAAYHRVGAMDIENGLWRFLCTAEVEGIDKARETMFAYPRKTRRPFPALLELYMGRGTVDAVLKEAEDGVTDETDRTTNLFYAHYYLGKYFEIMDNHALALRQVEESLKHEISHFMYACAETDRKRLRDRVAEAEPTR